MTVLYLAILILSLRFKKGLPAMLVILAVLQYTAAVISIEMMDYYGEDEAVLTFELLSNYMPITIFNCLLLAPAIEYVAFCYLPLFLTTVIYSVLRHSLNLKIIV